MEPTHHHHHHHHHRRQRRIPKKLAVVLGIAAAVAVLAGIYLLASKLEARYFADEVADANQPLSLQDSYAGAEEDVVYFDGREYRARSGLTTFLLLGVDDAGEAADSGVYFNRGQADFLMLALLDETAQTVTLLHINRDAMADVPVLDASGRSVGTSYEQLALAHTYGSGLDDSCENTVTAVSNYLYGVRIDHYLAVTMDAVAKLNDLVGGVTVVIGDEFAGSDLFTPGETVTLSGDEALAYVRARMEVGDGTNLARMERQRQYIDAFGRRFRERFQTDDSLALDAYQAIADYLVTDLEVDEFASLANNVAAFDYSGVESIAGEAKKGEQYMEFYTDDAALREQVLGLFYQEK